jgi:pimeloyl-ACP methyl ester carboxylesterase
LRSGHHTPLRSDIHSVLVLLTLVLGIGGLVACGDDDNTPGPDASQTLDSMVIQDAVVDAGPQPVGCSVSGEGSFTPDWENISFTATDGVTINGTIWIPAPGGSFAVVILLHQYCTSRFDWAQTTNLAEELAERGFLVMAYDARGFGQSNENNTINYCGESNGALFQPMIGDVDSALDYLATVPEANLDCVGLGGGSMGSSVALIAGAADPRVLTTVLLSPGLFYLGLNTNAALSSWNPRPVLMMAAAGDTDPVSDMNALAGAADNATTVTIAGDAHGASILAADEDAHQQVLDWFSDIL